MRNLFLTTLVALGLSAGTAVADSDLFSGAGLVGSFSASGFTNTPQSGKWSVGAMNESYGSFSVRETKTGVKLDSSSGSRTEGFGSNFRGFTAAGGAGLSGGFVGFSGRF